MTVEIEEAQLADARAALAGIRDVIEDRPPNVAIAAICMALIVAMIESGRDLDDALAEIDRIATEAKRQARETFADVAALAHGLQ